MCHIHGMITTRTLASDSEGNSKAFSSGSYVDVDSVYRKCPTVAPYNQTDVYSLKTVPYTDFLLRLANHISLSQLFTLSLADLSVITLHPC